MSLPSGWTPVELSPARAVPQSAPLAGAPQGTTVVLLATPTDLARLLSAPPEQAVHAAPRPATGPGTAAVDSVSTEATGAHLVVTRAGQVLTAWPVVARRALPVADVGVLLGHLWVDELRLTVGTLVTGGHHGARIVVGWRPLRALVARDPAVGRSSPHRPVQEVDPYDRLV